MKSLTLIEKDFEWLHWALDVVIDAPATVPENRAVLAALRAKLALVAETIPVGQSSGMAVTTSKAD